MENRVSGTSGSRQVSFYVTACFCFLAFTLLGLLAGCTSREVYRDPDFNPPVYWGSHTVKPGDSLYAIAWRYSRDPMELARANRLSPPYTLHPGQRISLVPPEGEAGKGVSKPQVAASTADASPQPSGRSTPVVNKKKHKSSQTVTSVSSNSQAQWKWPHDGPIIDKFSVTGAVNKGIDISGRLGDPVRAAADGEVVYAGNGLIGYGPLIILYHNEQYLSAYAHNRRLLVSEGDKVLSGEKIAELGDTGARQPMVHFEIRRNGQPVDPLQYLPAR